MRITNNSGINALYALSYVLSPVPPPTPTSTPPPGLSPDIWEPNDNIAEASIPAGSRPTTSFILPETPLAGLSFNPYTGRESTGDTADWFLFYGRAGSLYQFVTRDVRPGVETVVAVFFSDGMSLAPALPGTTNPNNRYIVGRRGSRVVIQPAYDGVYWVRVTNLDSTPRIAGMTYTLAMDELATWPMAPVFVPRVMR